MSTAAALSGAKLEEHHDPKQRWRNRRWMAWSSLVSALFIFPAMHVWVADLSGIATPFYTLAAAVVIIYIAGATAETVAGSTTPVAAGD